jgi:hypothetical protein
VDGERRRRAVVPLASTVRNVGGVDEAINLSTDEAAGQSDLLDDAVTAFPPDLRGPTTTTA